MHGTQQRQVDQQQQQSHQQGSAKVDPQHTALLRQEALSQLERTGGEASLEETERRKREVKTIANSCKSCDHVRAFWKRGSQEEREVMKREGEIWKNGRSQEEKEVKKREGKVWKRERSLEKREKRKREREKSGKERKKEEREGEVRKREKSGTSLCRVRRR